MQTHCARQIDTICQIFPPTCGIPHTDQVARELGPTAEAVRINLQRLRYEARLSLRQLADRMPPGPGALSHSSIGEIERGVRRVDVDELTALAAVLGVSPATLLLPVSFDLDAHPQPTAQPDEPVQLTGTQPEARETMLRWLRGDRPISSETISTADDFEAEAFRRRALPGWAWGWYHGGAI